MMVERAAAYGAATPTGLGQGETLLVRSWRRIAVGQGGCPVMVQEFTDCCGEDTAEVFATFCTFLRALAFASRRPLMIGPPGSDISPDERQALTLIAAAQADVPALFEAHLRWVARHDRRDVLRITAGALATALRANHLHLALPDLEPPEICVRKLASA